MESNNKIAVIGASSMVGSRFCEMQKKSELVKTGLREFVHLDITQENQIKSFFSQKDFSTAVLFSAFTDVNAAEKQRDDKSGLCWNINVNGTNNITESCNIYGKKLVFISTDFVFDGEDGPYGENDERATNLKKVSWYGITKIYAEEIVENKSKDYLIIRIAYPYRSKFKKKLDFARNILKLANEGYLYPMFSDQFITPTLVDDIAPALDLLLKSSQRGIYHIVSPQTTTPLKFAQTLLSKFKINKQVDEIAFSKYRSKGDAPKRPINSSLKTSKIQKLGFTPTDWKKGIDIIYKQLYSV